MSNNISIHLPYLLVCDIRMLVQIIVIAYYV